MASVDKRRIADGAARYDVRYRTATGSVRTRTFRTRRDAERFAATVEADKLRGTWIDPRRASRPFTETAEEWLTSNPMKRPTSMARDESIVRVHIIPALGDRSIGQITQRDVRHLVVAWSTKLAPRTVRRMFGVLRTIFLFAIESEVIGASPCRGVRLPPIAPLRRHVVSADELVLLADAHPQEFRPMVYLGALLGLRWGEVAGLRVGRIDFDAQTVTIAEQLTRGTQGLHYMGPPKSQAGHRTLAVPKSLMTMLADHLDAENISRLDREAMVFTRADGDPLEYSNWRRRTWVPAVTAAGLDGLTFHDLRRANATAMVLRGLDLKTAQTRLGHSDPRLTLGIYAQATNEADRAAADRLGEHFTARQPEPRAMDARWKESRGRERCARSVVDQPKRWSGCRDLNPGPQRPERCALTKLRHIP